MKPVYIVWEDCQVRDTGPWVDWQEWEYEPCYVHTVGFLLKETEQGYIVTESYRMDSVSTGPVVQIPKGCVVSFNYWDEQ